MRTGCLTVALAAMLWLGPVATAAGAPPRGDAAAPEQLAQTGHRTGRSFHPTGGSWSGRPGHNRALSANRPGGTSPAHRPALSTYRPGYRSNTQPRAGRPPGRGGTANPHRHLTGKSWPARHSFGAHNRGRSWHRDGKSWDRHATNRSWHLGRTSWAGHRSGASWHHPNSSWHRIRFSW